MTPYEENVFSYFVRAHTWIGSNDIEIIHSPLTPVLDYMTKNNLLSKTDIGYNRTLYTATLQLHWTYFLHKKGLI